MKSYNEMALLDLSGGRCSQDSCYIKAIQEKEIPEYIRERMKIGPEGYSIAFNESVEIQTVDLRSIGEILPLSARDFYNFVRRNVLDATKTCEMLQCTRQNISYMVKTEKIRPIICGEKENLYLKGEIEKKLYE